MTVLYHRDHPLIRAVLSSPDFASRVFFDDGALQSRRSSIILEQIPKQLECRPVVLIRFPLRDTKLFPSFDNFSNSFRFDVPIGVAELRFNRDVESFLHPWPILDSKSFGQVVAAD